MAIYSSELVGLPVLGSDGEKLGRVVQVEPDAFLVEKGLLFPADFEIGYGHVASVRDETVWLALPRRFYLDQAEYLRHTGGVVAARRIRTPALLAAPGSVPPDAGFRGAVVGPLAPAEPLEPLEPEPELAGPGSSLSPDGVYDEG